MNVNEEFRKRAQEAKAGRSHAFKDMQRGIESNPKFHPRAGESKEEAAAKIAASAGRKKFGKERFQRLAIMGKKAHGGGK